ncbi:hypothetical protein SRHO_G00060130 [Serrasalmus rhombeus]
MGRVSSCEIDKTSNSIGQKISDHDPVVLTLRRVQRQTVNKIPQVASMLERFVFSEIPDRSSGKINGIEILSAIKSMTDSGEEKPDGLTVSYYKRDQPTFNVDYLIFELILAKRLSVLLTLSSKKEKKTLLSSVSCYKLTLAERPTKIKWSFLKESLKNLAALNDFNILESLLSKDTGCEDFRYLRQGCPLTTPLLTLALKGLVKQLTGNGCEASFSKSRQTLFINADNDRYTKSQRKFKKTFLEQSLEDLKTTLKSLKKRFPPATSLTLFQSAPPPDFSILANLLPKHKEFTCLQQGCPLTRPILNLALKQLQYDLIRTGCMTSFCQFRQIIVVYAETPDTSQKADNSDISVETSQEADILEEAELDAFQKVDTSESDMSEETFEEADSSEETDTSIEAFQEADISEEADSSEETATSMKVQEFQDESEEPFEEEGFSEDDAYKETNITEEAHTFMQSSQESDAFEEAESDTSQKADTSEKENMLQKVWKLVEQFQEDSGIKLNVYPIGNQ